MLPNSAGSRSPHRVDGQWRMRISLTRERPRTIVPVIWLETGDLFAGKVSFVRTMTASRSIPPRLAADLAPTAMLTTVAVALASVGSPAHASGAGSVQFVDRSVETGVLFQHSPSYQMIPPAQVYMMSGAAVGDFNDDGLPDLFALGGGNTPDRLFINQGDGTFTNEAPAWGVDALHGGCGACVGDFDGNGLPDIFVSSFGTGSNGQGQLGKNRLYRNEGGAAFVDVAADAGVNQNTVLTPSAFGCAWGDYDLDGDLDLAVLAWFANANGNRLYRNEGDGTFTDVTGTAIVFPPGTWGFQPAFADMDGDGWPELLVAADFKTSRYFRNNGDGTFTNWTLQSGTGLDENGMGQTIGDIDNDGKLDWYVTSIYMAVPSPSTGSGNKLYRATAPHAFVEIGQAAGVHEGGWGWGAVAVDVDNDGLLDLVEVNGRPAGEWINVQEYLWINNGDLTFTEVALSSGLDYVGEGRTIVWLDHDRDGRLDLVIGFNQDNLRLYRNETEGGNWLHLNFDTRNNPHIAPHGLGARVKLMAGGQTIMRYVDGGSSFLGTSEPAAHFGLGSLRSIDKVRIEWPRGYVTEILNPSINQHLTVHAPDLADLNGDGAVDAADLGMLLLRWGKATQPGELVADLNGDGVVDAADLGIMLLAWTG